MIELIVLAGAGVLGNFMRAYVTKRQDTWSRETVGECFVGLLTGLLYNPLIGPVLNTMVELPAIADPLVAIVTKAALLMLATYVLGDLIQNLLPGKLGRLMGGGGPKPETPPTT